MRVLAVGWAAAVGSLDRLVDAVHEPANDLAVRDWVLPAVDDRGGRSDGKSTVDLKADRSVEVGVRQPLSGGKVVVLVSRGAQPRPSKIKDQV